MRWTKVRMKSKKRRYRLRTWKTNSTTCAPNRKLELRNRKNGRKNLWIEIDCQFIVDHLRVKVCQLNFIQLAPLILFIPVLIQKKRMGTYTNGSSKKVTDASTQIPAILLARRTGKGWYYQGHPNHVETLPSLKKRIQQCGISTPHQVVNPVPSNRQIFVCT